MSEGSHSSSLPNLTAAFMYYCWEFLVITALYSNTQVILGAGRVQIHVASQNAIFSRLNLVFGVCYRTQSHTTHLISRLRSNYQVE